MALGIPERRDEALDGLRGIAVLLVIAVHLQLVRFGWVGVQLFFVLSGFLITRILLADRVGRTLGSYLKCFYMRRALRILPALYLYLVGMGLVAWLMQSWDAFGPNLAPAALFFTNLAMLSREVPIQFEDWQGFATNHLWSLAVEEHFYLLWPLVVYAAGTRHLLKVVLCCIAAGPLLRWGAAGYWLSEMPQAGESMARAVYVISTSHLDAFASGALVCLLPAIRQCRPWPRIAMLVIAAAMTAALGIANNLLAGDGLRHALLTLGIPGFMKNGTQYVWGYSVLNLLFAQLVAVAIHVRQVHSLLAHRWLTYTGRISYGLYLIHLPFAAVVLAALKWLDGRGWESHGFTFALIVALYLATTYAIASASYWFYEAPLLKLRLRWGGATPAATDARPQYLSSIL